MAKDDEIRLAQMPVRIRPPELEIQGASYQAISRSRPPINNPPQPQALATAVQNATKPPLTKKQMEIQVESLEKALNEANASGNLTREQFKQARDEASGLKSILSEYRKTSEFPPLSNRFSVQSTQVKDQLRIAAEMKSAKNEQASARLEIAFESSLLVYRSAEVALTLTPGGVGSVALSAVGAATGAVSWKEAAVSAGLAGTAAIAGRTLRSVLALRAANAARALEETAQAARVTEEVAALQRMRAAARATVISPTEMTSGYSQFAKEFKDGAEWALKAAKAAPPEKKAQFCKEAVKLGFEAVRHRGKQIEMITRELDAARNSKVVASEIIKLERQLMNAKRAEAGANEVYVSAHNALEAAPSIAPKATVVSQARGLKFIDFGETFDFDRSAIEASRANNIDRGLALGREAVRKWGMDLAAVNNQIERAKGAGALAGEAEALQRYRAIAMQGLRGAEMRLEAMSQSYLRAVNLAEESRFLSNLSAAAKKAVPIAQTREAVPLAFKSTHKLVERFGSDKIITKIGRMLPPEFQEAGESIYYLKDGTRTAKAVEMIQNTRVYFANSLINAAKLSDKERVLFSAYTNVTEKPISVALQDAAKEFIGNGGTYAEAERFINEITTRVRQISLKISQRSFAGHIANPSDEQLVLFARARHLGGNVVLTKFQALPEIFLDIIKSEEAAANAAKASAAVR